MCIRDGCTEQVLFGQPGQAFLAAIWCLCIILVVLLNRKLVDAMEEADDSGEQFMREKQVDFSSIIPVKSKSVYCMYGK